jgi:hypothetical protein
MGVSLQHDSAAYTRTVPILTSTTVVSLSSNGAPNATEVSGRIIDRLALGRLYLSAKVAITYMADTPSTSGVAFAGRIQHATSTAAGDFANFLTTGFNVTRTATATSTSLVGAVEFGADLRTARRFLRVLLTPTLIASSSGNLAYGAALEFGGADELPKTAQANIATTS